MSKSFYVTFFIIIILGASALATVNFGEGQTGTNVTGIISSDTTWTKAGSPYTLTGDVVINNAVTLTIEKGVTVNLGLSNLQANGTLNVQGSLDNKVTFNSEYTDTRPYFGRITSFSPSCVIENAIIHTAQIDCYNSIVLNNDIIDLSEISIWSGKGQISNDNLTNVGIISRGATTFSGNSYICTPPEGSLGVEGRILIQSGSAVIHNNTINMGNSSINFVAISIDDCSAIITDNIISNSNYHGSNSGITGSGGNYTIERNLIEYISIGIQLSSASGLVTNNTVINNSIGLNIIESTKQAVEISNNNIYGNIKNNFYLGTIGNSNSPSSAINIDATNNWWGTTDEQAINQSIFDSKNDSNLGDVTFIPFLTQSNPEAVPNLSAPTPTLPPIPTPTPSSTLTPSTTPTLTPTLTPSPTLASSPSIPEFQSWTILLLGAVCLLSVAVFLRKSIRKNKL